MNKRFDVAKEEFLSQDDNDRHRLVYAYFGLAIYFGQCLEETFSIMLWTNRIFEKKAQTNQEINEILDAIENSKKTMGNFIYEVKQSYNLASIIVTQLNSVLEKRNYLAHKYFKLHIEKFHSEIGQLEMIKYFCEFIDESKSLDQELEVYYQHYIEKLGITEEMIAKLIAEMKEQELERAKSFESKA